MSEEVQPYRDSAAEYLRAGWNPLPLLGARGSKGKVPHGFTGYRGADVSRPDVRRWSRDAGHSNVALRMPRNVVGLDLDDYVQYSGEPDHKGRRDVRHPAGTASASLAALESEHGPLPPTLRVSSRFGDDYDNVSGTRLYRLPGQYADLADQKVWRSGWDAIDIVPFGHRQQVVWPSVHDSGRTYRYLDEASGEIVADVLPSPEELPVLPEAWCSALMRRRGAGGPALDLGNLLTGGEQCRAVRHALEQVMSESQSGRHAAMLRGTARLVRLGEQGHEGVGEAMSELRTVYVEAVGSERDGAGEFDRAADGAADLVSGDPTPDDGKGCCPKVREGVKTYYPEVEDESSSTDSESSSTTPGGQGDGSERPPMLSEEFRRGHDRLEAVRRIARARLAPPDATLLNVLVRVCLSMPPYVVLPAVVGGDNGTLNLFGMPVGKSSDGKNLAMTVARFLVPDEELHVQPLGSGEGLVAAYFGWKTVPVGKREKQVYEQVRDTALVHDAEGSGLKQLADRSGSTLVQAILKAAHGQEVGSGNSNRDRSRPSVTLRPGTYRMGMVLEVQPDAAGFILELRDKGLPQRFVALSAHDPGKDADLLEPLSSFQTFADGWTPSALSVIGTTDVVEVPHHIQREVAVAVAEAGRTWSDRAEDELRSHRPRLVLQLARAIGAWCRPGAVPEVTDEDFRLANLLLDTSFDVLDWLNRRGTSKALEAGLRRTAEAVDRQKRIGAVSIRGSERHRY